MGIEGKQMLFFFKQDHPSHVNLSHSEGKEETSISCSETSQCVTSIDPSYTLATQCLSVNRKLFLTVLEAGNVRLNSPYVLGIFMLKEAADGGCSTCVDIVPSRRAQWGPGCNVFLLSQAFGE